MMIIYISPESRLLPSTSSVNMQQKEADTEGGDTTSKVESCMILQQEEENEEQSLISEIQKSCL